MDEDLLRQLLASQEGLEFSPTAEMMMMNSATAQLLDDVDPSDAEMAEALERQTIDVNRSVISSAAPRIVEEEEDAFIEDETILERIAALKEMFPESVQNAAGAINRAVINTSKLACSKGRSAAWW